MHEISLLAYIKATDFCNVGCDHCYLPREVRGDRYVMNEDTFKASIKVVKGMIKQRQATRLTWLYHGGEPLMLSPSYYYRMGNILDQSFNDIDIFESVQTSLVPFTKKWSGLIKERWQGTVGASIDFSTRTISGSPDKYLDFIEKKIELVRSEDIYVSFGMVPSIKEIGREKKILDWFIKNDIRYFGIDRYNDFGYQDPNRPSNEKYSKFLINLFNESIKRIREGKDIPRNNVLLAAINGVLFGVSGDRWGGSCMSDYIIVSPRGETNNCADKLPYEKSFSNVKDGALSFLSSESRLESILHQLHGHREHHCFTCRYSSWCKSGCPITSNNRDIEGDCSGYKLFLDYINNFVGRNQDSIEVLKYYVEGKL